MSRATDWVSVPYLLRGAANRLRFCLDYINEAIEAAEREHDPRRPDMENLRQQLLDLAETLAELRGDEAND